ncbi:MAG: SPOR domain-containing protein [Tannerella sp.]|jgi:hypothetical protein|nr:SPOR domain-containing protein [Tannerella sp.]
MLEIATHIERLLRVNDCVIIPDFGGFVLQNCPAVYERDTHLFRPSCKEIIFNPTLRHDDGLIAGSYMQAYGMVFSRARAALKKDIEKLNVALDEQSEVRLEGIGLFRKEVGETIVFHPVADCSHFSLSSYGLAPFHLPPVPVTKLVEKRIEHQKPPLRKSGHVIYLPVNRTLVYIAGISVTAVALSLMIATPVKVVNPTSYTASFAPSEIVKKMIPSGDTLLAVEKENATAQEENAVETAVQPAAAIPVEQANGMNPAKTYYVVIGSFNTESQAQTFIKELGVSPCLNIGIVWRDKHFRVFADKYDNRKDAEDRISLLREDARFRNAWLFAGK